jgi:CDK inhibitor PHO81
MCSCSAIAVQGNREQSSIHATYSGPKIARCWGGASFSYGVEIVSLLNTLQVSFEINIISSFDGVTLEVGGDVETYWKSTGISIIPDSLSPWPQRSHLIGSAQTSPSTHALSSSTAQASTVSSLRGKFVTVVIQVTRDLHPVVYTDWLLPTSEFELSVCDVTLQQFELLAIRSERNLEESNVAALRDWSALMPKAMVSLVQLLTVSFCRYI